MFAVLDKTWHAKQTTDARKKHVSGAEKFVETLHKGRNIISAKEAEVKIEAALEGEMPHSKAMLEMSENVPDITAPFIEQQTNSITKEPRLSSSFLTLARVRFHGRYGDICIVILSLVYALHGLSNALVNWLGNLAWNLSDTFGLYEGWLSIIRSKINCCRGIHITINNAPVHA